MSKDPNATRRAGQRTDELLPGQSNENAAADNDAVGTPGGGLAAGGLAGTNAADGGYDDEDQQQNALSAGIYDHNGDDVNEEQPESGRAGGAAGGTPAGKRAGPRPHDPE